MLDKFFGARLVAPGRTEFRFWAPSLTMVDVEIEGHAPIAMTAQPDGWFGCEIDCGAGTRYRYRVAPELAVPDPASHQQAGDVHDASMVVDHETYRWQHPAWAGRPWHETVLYELHVGTCGGFAGTAKRLPALAALGVTAIELMPIAEFPGAHSWGYDGVLPYAPDAAYGTPDELKALIDAAHGMGMMVFLDVVYNHFGPDGNYLGAYAGRFFRNDVLTPWGEAIDFRVSEVRNFFTGNALHWLHTYRFDGLRFDAVHAITDPDWLREVAQEVRAATPPGRKVHLVVENDDNDAGLLTGVEAGLYDGQWNDDVHHALHVLLTGEHEGYYGAYADRPAEKLARGLAEGFIYQGEAPQHAGGALRGTPSAHLPPTAFVNFLQNHDQTGNRAFGERLTVLADPQALASAQALLLLMPAIPLLFMGEETGAREPFLYFTDHADPTLAEAVRHGRRQEFARFAAFSDPAFRVRIPDPNSTATYLQSHLTPLEAEALMLADVPADVPANVPADTPPAAFVEPSTVWLARLLALRHAHIVPGLPGACSLGARAIAADAVCARWRLGNGRRLTIVISFAATPLPIDVALENEHVSLPGGDATVLVETNDALQSMTAGVLPARSMIAFLDAA